MVGSGNAARQDGHSPRACVLGCMQATSQKLSLRRRIVDMLDSKALANCNGRGRIREEGDRLDSIVIRCSGRRSGICFPDSLAQNR